MSETVETPETRLGLLRLFCGSLFSGIGGMDLGLERAGFKLKWQVEIDPYCRRVLERHWPDVRRWDDVRTWPQPDTERVDLLCGGFPCQDISAAGNKAGIEGERSGLWREYARIIRELRPPLVLVENVAALLDRGIDRVLCDLAEMGYDAEWAVLPACAFDAPHSRERLFCIAYANGGELRTSGPSAIEAGATRLHFDGAEQTRQVGSWWSVEPEPCSVVYGVPGVVDRLRGFGNAVVPQVAEWIGRRIIAAVS